MRLLRQPFLAAWPLQHQSAKQARQREEEQERVMVVLPICHKYNRERRCTPTYRAISVKVQLDGATSQGLSRHTCITIHHQREPCCVNLSWSYLDFDLHDDGEVKRAGQGGAGKLLKEDATQLQYTQSHSHTHNSLTFSHTRERYNYCGRRVFRFVWGRECEEREWTSA